MWNKKEKLIYMRNNFTFCSSIKVKKLDKMEEIINLLYGEKIDNDDLKICVEFRNMLDLFDKDIKQVKSFDVIEKFNDFYDKILVPYCKKELIMVDKFEYFDFEQTQYVFDKIGEIIDVIGDKYGVN